MELMLQQNNYGVQDSSCSALTKPLLLGLLQSGCLRQVLSRSIACGQACQAREVLNHV